MKSRILLGAFGVPVGVYGVWLLLSRQDLGQIVDAGIWLGAGVVFHDFVLTAVVLVVAMLGARLLPAAARTPVTVGLIVLGTLTLVALPVLTGYGVSDEPGLQERPYVTAWWVLAALTVVIVVVATVLRARRNPAAKD